ncbi:MAG: hypothetical protein JEZ06_13115 [Anaerolineaceae bacterium]|nr:hypothetical protein [Anaerolineaceae bacterium]
MMKKKIILVLGLVILIALIAIILGLFFGVKYFRNYQEETIRQPISKLSVNLISSEDTVSNGELIFIQSTAYSAEGDRIIEELSIWSGNVLVHNRKFENQNLTMVNTVYPWIPAEEGEHVFVARVTDIHGNLADSDPMIVNVVQGVEPEMKQDEPEADPSNDIPPSGDDFVGDGGVAEPWEGSLGGWLLPKTSDDPPIAPELIAKVDACQVSLSFMDKSNDELGFRVYHNLPNIPGWKLTNTLAANDSMDFLTYTESGYHGNLSYKVAAFNSQGESFSNVVSISINPSDCPQMEIPILELELIELTPKTPVDNLYCYYSPGGAYWQRWPKIGFAPGGPDGIKNTGNKILTILEDEDGQVSPDFSLILDCWGWAGGELLDLGLIEIADLHLQMDPIAFENDFLKGLLDFGKVTTMDGDLDGLYHSMFLPVPVLSHSNDTDLCVGKSDYYSNIPSSYCYKADGETPWPFQPSFIMWKIESNCQNGVTCYNILEPETMPYPELVNAEYGYNVYSTLVSYPIRSFNSAHQMVFNVPGTFGTLNCNTPTTSQFRVTSYMIPAGSQQMYESEKSIIFVPDPCPAVSGAVLDVSAQDIVLSPGITEEPGEGELLDVYGMVLIYTSNFSIIHPLRFGEGEGGKDPGCPVPDSPDEAGGIAFGGRCPISNGWGVDMDNAAICQAGGLDGCLGTFLPQNNHVEITLLEGETLNVHLIIMDDDQNSADDVICSAETTLPAWNTGYWLASIGDFTAIEGDGNCLMNILVKELYTFEN